MVKAVLLGIGVLVIIGGVGYVVYQNSNSTGTTQNQTTATQPGTEKPVTPKPNESTETAGTYEDYAEAKLQNANSGSVVLFFNAAWCPDCRATAKDVEANRAKIPAGVTILSVDYDTYTDLRKKYGVTYQHTFVQVDTQGNQLKKWGGSFTLNDIVAQIE